MTEQMKTAKASATALSQLVLPSQGNPAGTAHGGELLKMMDNCAGVCAEKHTRSLVVTAGIDNVIFFEPVFIGNQATCNAYVTYTSRRSLEVAVSIHAEDLRSGEETCCMTAYFIFCAVNENMKSKDVPPIKPSNEREQREFEEGKKRAEIRKKQTRACWLPLY